MSSLNQLPRRRMEGTLVLFITATIWGFAFVVQSVAMDSIGPFTFNGARFLLGGVTLLPLLFCRRYLRFGAEYRRSAGESRARGKNAVCGGILCGIALCAARLFQQFGIMYTTTAKAGFLTALYIILVPFYSIPLGRKPGRNVFAGAFLALIGLYLLCMEGGLRLSRGDLLCILGAFLYPLQILAVDHFAQKTDPVSLSCAEFLTAGALCLVPAFVFENPSAASLCAAAAPILYMGILSSGVAYTLQAVGQQMLRNPSLASLCMSFESVFAAIAGWLFLHQSLSPQKMLGCAVMFAAILIAQR